MLMIGKIQYRYCGASQQYKTLKHIMSMNWKQNGICENLVLHLPATSSVRSVNGCVAHALDSFSQQIPLMMMRPVASTAQSILEAFVINVADDFCRVNCSFYFKIGACRHGDRCSRMHNRPTYSQTILLQNLFLNPQHATTAESL